MAWAAKDYSAVRNSAAEFLAAYAPFKRYPRKVQMIFLLPDTRYAAV
jgi:hypothetical protein